MTEGTRFEAFVREYQDMVFATAVRLLGREAEAEDVARTVFLRAFERPGELEGSLSKRGEGRGLEPGPRTHVPLIAKSL